MTAAGARHELLYDTEAALRLVDGEVRAMTGVESEVESGPTPDPLARARAEVEGLLARVRESHAALDALAAGAASGPADATDTLGDAVRAVAGVEARLAAAAGRLGP